MSSPTAALLSFRLGGTDGVSVEARKWEWALQQRGFDTRRIAGELIDELRPDDAWLPYLAIEPEVGVDTDGGALSAAIAGADLVVAENLCSLPLNLDAATFVVEVLGAWHGRVLFHHHDLPWERSRFAHLTGFPPARPNSLHVTINDAARQALATRGIEVVTIRNAFDLSVRAGDRVGTRAASGFADEDLVVLQPTRAIPRKEVARGIEFAERLATLVADRDVRFWLTGPAEDGFETELERLLREARVPVTLGRADRAVDAYAASDIVVLPSSWEGFGNPIIEAMLADRPVAAAPYPVLEELRQLGLSVLPIDHPEVVVEWLVHPDPAVSESNRECLRAHFDLADLPERVAAAFATVGWEQW